MQTCPRCGAPVPAGWQQCPVCGAVAGSPDAVFIDHVPTFEGGTPPAGDVPRFDAPAAPPAQVPAWQPPHGSPVPGGPQQASWPASSPAGWQAAPEQWAQGYGAQPPVQPGHEWPPQPPPNPWDQPPAQGWEHAPHSPQAQPQPEDWQAAGPSQQGSPAPQAPAWEGQSPQQVWPAEVNHVPAAPPPQAAPTGPTGPVDDDDDELLDPTRVHGDGEPGSPGPVASGHAPRVPVGAAEAARPVAAAAPARSGPPRWVLWVGATVVVAALVVLAAVAVPRLLRRDPAPTPSPTPVPRPVGTVVDYTTTPALPGAVKVVGQVAANDVGSNIRVEDLGGQLLELRGRLLVTGSASFGVVDASTGAWMWKQPSRNTRCAAHAVDRVACVSDGTVTVYDIASGEATGSWKTTSEARLVRPLPDRGILVIAINATSTGGRLIAADEDGKERWSTPYTVDTALAGITPQLVGDRLYLHIWTQRGSKDYLVNVTDGTVAMETQRLFPLPNGGWTVRSADGSSSEVYTADLGARFTVDGAAVAQRYNVKVDDRFLLVVTSDGKVARYTMGGTRSWELAMASPPTSVTQCSQTVVLGLSGRTVALTADGRTAWEQENPAGQAPVSDVYCAGTSHVVAVHASATETLLVGRDLGTGTQLWTATLPGSTQLVPTSAGLAVIGQGIQLYA